MCRALNTPVTGGNVSFHNESQQHAVFPTPTIGMLGLIDDVSTIVGNSFRTAGEHVMMIGWHRAELGGSEYLKVINGKITGDAPSFEIDQEVRLQKVVLAAIRGGLVSAAHDCSEGGLLVALAEMTFGAGVGVVSTVPFAHHAADLFGEAQSRILVSVPPQHVDALTAACAAADVPVTSLGMTGGERFEVAELVSAPVAELAGIHGSSLTTIMTSR